MVQLKDKLFEPFITSQQLETRIGQLADSLNTDYVGQLPLFVVILNGAFMFAADLIKRISIPCEVTFIRLSSYQETRSTGNVVQLLGLQEKLENRHVVIIEDIVDTGNTMTEVLKDMQSQYPASLQIASLLVKPEALQSRLEVRYLGFEIPNRFVIGYGLDYEGQGRNLPDLYQLKS
jgi:hypoxanthine phosphoribosyltransferase